MKKTWPLLHNPSHQLSSPPQSFNAVCKSTVNLDFLRLQHKRTRIQKIQQGNKNVGNWKGSRKSQTKKWLIMLNWLSEDKE